MKRRHTLLAVAVAAALAAAAGSYTWAAFVATTGNTGNSISSGTVRVSDNDTGTALLALSTALPGATDTGCIKVTYNGSISSTVRLYGTTGGSGLDPYIDLRITRGAYNLPEPGYDSCTNFQPDSTDYIGAGAGVIYDGTLQGFPDSYAAGLTDPTAGTPESWTTGEPHVYRMQVTLQNSQAAEGLAATQTFTWEARNQ
jgi:hypothetical protein